MDEDRWENTGHGGPLQLFVSVIVQSVVRQLQHLDPGKS